MNSVGARVWWFGLLVLAAFVPSAADMAVPTPDSAVTHAELGRALFVDANLSQSRTQSCASCHSPARAYSELLSGRAAGAVATSSDGALLGTRNVPSLAYASLVPTFARIGDNDYRGGLFHDGRAANLAEQAAQPLIDPREMQLADAGAVVERLRENPQYAAAFARLYGVDLAGPVDAVMIALGRALAAYQHTPEFVAFDSRYDRSLRGELQLTEREARGRDLFFSSLTSCARCHVLDGTRMAANEPFSSYRYFNIGTPANARLAALPGTLKHVADAGLAANPLVRDDERSAMAGRFRVPTLRNVAITGPYMHNGVFARLDTAVAFYNQYLGKNASFAVNPETGVPWAPPEVAETIELGLLREGQPMEADRIGDLVAFLRALTDRRYEHLLDQSEATAADGGVNGW